MKDWTNYYDQFHISGETNKIIENIIKNIYNCKFPLHTHNNMTIFELSLIYKWPIFVGVNTFVERLLKVSIAKKKNIDISFPKSKPTIPFFKNTVESVQYYYYDFSINYKLLNDITDIIFDSQKNKQFSSIEFAKPQEKLFHHHGNLVKIKRFFKNIFLFCEKCYIMKPKIVGENSNWFRDIFIFGHSIDFYNHKFANLSNNIDYKIRGEFKNIFKDDFIKGIKNITGDISDDKLIDLAELFSHWIINILPPSIIEGLTDRFNYYHKTLNGWEIKYLHSFTGYYYNDNFKIFAIIAKRRGTKLVGHTHGASNYMSTYKRLNELQFLDYYTTYGIIEPDIQLSNISKRQIKFIPTGSINLNKLKKWNKSKISNENITLLYPSGPLMDFATYLQEISYKKNLKHRINLLRFLDKLLQKYKGLQVLYKPFPGTYTNDPIKQHCTQYINEGRIKLTNKKPFHLYPLVDLVLWDSISTGFAESVVSDTPVIVFNSNHEYKQVSSRGKVINDLLTDVGLQCFDIESAMKSFDRILNNLNAYKNDTAEAIQVFKKDMAMPVTQKEWHLRFNNNIG